MELVRKWSFLSAFLSIRKIKNRKTKSEVGKKMVVFECTSSLKIKDEETKSKVPTKMIFTECIFVPQKIEDKDTKSEVRKEMVFI